MKYRFTYLISGTFTTYAEGKTPEEAQEKANEDLRCAYEDTEVLLNIIGDELFDMEELK